MSNYRGKVIDISNLTPEERTRIAADSVGVVAKSAYVAGRKLAEHHNAQMEAIIDAIRGDEPPAIVEDSP